MAYDPNRSRKARMEANYLISLDDPGRFSSQTNRALQTFVENEGLDQSKRIRDHEMYMLQQKGENDNAKAEWDAYGKQYAGSEAAEYAAIADIKKAEEQRASASEVAEIERAGATERNAVDAATKREIARLEHGWVDEQGVRHAGSRETVAEVEGRNARERELDLQKEKNAGIKITADATVAAAEAKERANNAEQRAYDKWLGDAARNPMLWTEIKNLTPEERKAYWLKLTGRVQ